jgi:gamma-glutamylcyclotransferase (GGCT)/AIG2-like uncharacterized protein YtfP
MDDPRVFYLFVYGSLRSGFKSDAYEYVSKYFSLKGEATVQGLLYDLGGYSAAVPTNDQHFIKGELYQIKNPVEFNWAIGQLDDYEGISGNPGEANAYYRGLTEATTTDGNKFTTWIYSYAGNVQGKPVIESGDFLEYLQNKK